MFRNRAPICLNWGRGFNHWSGRCVGVYYATFSNFLYVWKKSYQKNGKKIVYFGIEWFGEIFFFFVVSLNFYNEHLLLLQKWWNDLKIKDSLGISRLGFAAFTARVWVQPLVRELRSYKLCGSAKIWVNINKWKIALVIRSLFY